MLCDCRSFRSPRDLRAKVADAGLVRVTGTWDFKWTPGTNIRVAIQDLPEGERRVDLKAARGHLQAALEAWIPSQGPGPKLSWTLLPDFLAGPAEPKVARSDPNRLAERPYVEHDVLVSFAPLPATIPATSEHPAREVNFPRSELGTYARRTEYGVPTLFLGPHEGFKLLDPSGTVLNFEEVAAKWLDSAEGRFTVIHEVGHVLGLAHEQQNRTLQGELEYRPIEEMREIAKRRNARTPPDAELDAFIHSEIIDPWPGDTRFSDWREPPVVQGGVADFDSVMAKPVYRCFLAAPHREDFDCKELDVCPFEQAEFERLDKPTASDLKQLARMYGRR